MSKLKVEPGDYVNIHGLKKEQIDEIVAVFQAAGGVNNGDVDYDKPYLMLDRRDMEVWTFSSESSCGMKRQIKASDLVEDRSTWHPHHDVIVAWAKGAKVHGREKGENSWRWEWDPLDPGDPAPTWEIGWEYEVIQEPDNTELAQIEQEMRKLADRLEKLK